MSAVEFKPWPKTPRLFREVVITEKIDGTNAAVIVAPLDVDPDGGPVGDYRGAFTAVRLDDGSTYVVGAQSRNRLIHPGADNYGFAAWVDANARELARILGPGHHYGEWWGSGIQRGYGLTNGDRRFSLFNVERYASDVFVLSTIPGLGVVPVLYRGDFDTERVEDALSELQHYGSTAAPGFLRPEGLAVFHTAANSVFKVLIDRDDVPKTVAKVMHVNMTGFPSSRPLRPAA